MAKQVIVLDTNPQDGGFFTVKAAFWFPIAADRRIPRPSARSVWTDAGAQENTDIETGATLEEVHEVRVPSGTGANAIKTALLNAYTARASWLAAQPARGQYYGVFHDSVTLWSA